MWSAHCCLLGDNDSAWFRAGDPCIPLRDAQTGEIVRVTGETKKREFIAGVCEEVMPHRTMW